jgi:hypothetical protein
VWDTEHTLYDASWDCTLLWRCLNGAAAIFGEDARVAIRVLPVLTITTKLPAHDAEVSYHIAPALRFKGDEDDDDEEDEEEEDEDEDDEDDEDDELDSDWNSDWDPNWDDLHNDLMVEQ